MGSDGGAGRFCVQAHSEGALISAVDVQNLTTALADEVKSVGLITPTVATLTRCPRFAFQAHNA